MCYLFSLVIHKHNIASKIKMGKTFTTSKFHIVPTCLNFISSKHKMNKGGKKTQEQGRKESTRTMDKLGHD
jgi:hypothetical protein